jgi:hypothetical protein
LAGIRRAISRSRSSRSRPVELRWAENASSGGHTCATPAGHNLIVILLRPRAGGPPTYCCLSDHVNYKLRGCLNVLGASAIRSARHFQANNCYRRGGRQQCQASRTNAESRERIPQSSNDGEIGSDAVRGASCLDRTRAKASPLSPIDLWEE